LKVRALVLVLCLVVAGCRHQATKPLAGPFSEQELKQFTSLNPIDAHTHVFVNDPEFLALLNRLNLHLLNIIVVDDTNDRRQSLAAERQEGWDFAHASDNRVSVCTTFDPYLFSKPDFSQSAIRQINADFDRGAVAVKIWKNVGMELKNASGNYVLPDNPTFEPIYQDIAAHNKTLIEHLAEPDAAWEAANPKSLSYRYYRDNPQWSMYSKPGAPSKAKILEARDHVMEQHPTLRVVGAHLGSMEDDFTQLGEHLDRYPNFAVDLAGRMPYLMKQPRNEMIAFVTKYQDRLIFGTDLEMGFGEKEVPGAKPALEDNYARVWRYFATDDTLTFADGTIQGLALPPSVVRKIYHDNAVRWFPGIM